MGDWPMTDPAANASLLADLETMIDGASGSPLDAATVALRESNARFEVLCDAMPQMVWSTLPDGYHDYYNARWYEFTGMPKGSTDGEAWNGMFHPDDQDRAWGRWRNSLATGEAYEIEYRLRHHSGDYRWTLGRALPVRDATGAITRWIGTCTDIDDAKRNAAHNEILSRELSHRIKNIFAVIVGLVGLSARRKPEAKEYAAELQARIGALARAHEFVRPHSEESRPSQPPSTLRNMLIDLLGAYPALDDGRIAIVGDDVALDDRGATPIALVFHELATNAMKYGALAAPVGRIDISIVPGPDRVTVRWTEAGGPPVAGVPVREGFGTKLAEISIRQQLGGRIDRHWRHEGLCVEIDVPRAHLVR